MVPQNSRTEPGLTKEQFEKFKSCLHDLYGVEYKGHDFHWPGDESNFYGHTDAWRHWYDPRAIGDFTVRTDQHSYEIKDIKRKIDPAGTGRGATGLTVGLTDSANPYVNAIAADAGFTGGMRGSEFFGLWVYELGNALSDITGKTPEVPADARDRYGVSGESGAAFEDCVFGGRLNSSGSVTPPK